MYILSQDKDCIYDLNKFTEVHIEDEAICISENDDKESIIIGAYDRYENAIMVMKRICGALSDGMAVFVMPGEVDDND